MTELGNKTRSLNKKLFKYSLITITIALGAYLTIYISYQPEKVPAQTPVDTIAVTTDSAKVIVKDTLKADTLKR